MADELLKVHCHDQRCKKVIGELYTGHSGVLKCKCGKYSLATGGIPSTPYIPSHLQPYQERLNLTKK